MKRILIFFFFLNSFLSWQQESPILLTEAEFVVKNRSSETFYFGLAKGDVLQFTTDISSSIYGITVGEYKAERVFEVRYADSIGNHRINIDHDGIYYIRFSQSGFLAGKRYCSLKAFRIPQSATTRSFNSTVYWRTLSDTIRYTEDERNLIRIDTVVSDIASEIITLKKPGKKNLNNGYLKFNLPDSCSNWSYFIATGKTTDAIFKQKEHKLADTDPLVRRYGLMGAIAIANSASFPSESDCAPVMSVFFYPVYGKNEIFRDSVNQFYGEFNSCLEFGKVKRGSHVPNTIALRNESKKAVNVLVKITAVYFHEIWGIRQVEKIRVETRQEPYLEQE